VFAVNLMQHMVVPTFVLDQECRVIIWNPACERLTGVPAVEIIGTRDHWKAFYAEPRLCLADIIVKGLSGELGSLYSYHAEPSENALGLKAENWCVMPRLDQHRYLAIDAGPIYSNEGQLLAVVETLRDLTERKVAEEALNQAKQHAEAASEKLRVLHEINMDDLVVANDIMSQIMCSEGLSDSQLHYFQLPAHQFSGDIIAAARDDKGDLRVMLADVTGHGLQAALYLLPISRVFYSMVKKGLSTKEIVKEMNQTMREIASTGRFIAAAVAHVSRNGAVIEVWNGGIPSAIYSQQNGKIHKFSSKHLPLGVVNADNFDSTTEIFHAQPGVLLFCSDGLTEAEDASGEPFGDSFFDEIVRASPPDELYGNLISALSTHLGGGVAHDDLSIVLAECEFQV
jgi:serine phosphatase RsbU (regulator of sigma subunit)